MEYVWVCTDEGCFRAEVIKKKRGKLLVRYRDNEGYVHERWIEKER